MSQRGRRTIGEFIFSLFSSGGNKQKAAAVAAPVDRGIVKNRVKETPAPTTTNSRDQKKTPIRSRKKLKPAKKVLSGGMKFAKRLKKKKAGEIVVAAPIKATIKPILQLHRYEHNPIIEPKKEQPWESKATFNPAALTHDGKVYLIYRAIGDSDESVLGHAVSHDGIHIHQRSPLPAFFQKKEERQQSSPVLAVPYSSGGGWRGGCEDPRLTLLDDAVYLIYTAFDGWGSIRVALSSISLDDFLHEKWDWSKPVYISPPGQIHKNWLLFPEKIKGKFAILHSISPKILIDYIDNIKTFDGQTFIQSHHGKSRRSSRVWDSWIRGGGPPPLKTKYGWLLLYHAMDHRDPNRYKLGALLLDLKDPTKVLYRSRQPILEPDELYENQGFKWGVIYSCGAAIVENTLFVYYGGADRVACVAAADLDSFLKQLMNEGASKLKRATKAKHHSYV